MTIELNQKDQILTARYGDQAKPDNIIWNDQIARLLQHRSVRNFQPDPLPDGAIETMVAAAQSASTSSNLHQWSVVAVTDRELKAKLGDLASGASKQGNKYIGQAPALLLWVADLSRSNAITREAGADTTVHDFLDAFLMASIDAALAAQNAIVAAESLGLGVVCIGGMRNEAKAVAELINLPAHSYVTFGLVVGLPAHNPDRPETIRPRPPQDVVLHHNQYDFERSMKGLDAYEAEFKKFRASIGTADQTWKQTVVGSNSMAYMDGRENLRQTVVERGFALL